MDARADIEVWNNSDERSYVVAEPSEIVDAGTSGEQRRTERDPEQRGLLVSPARMILEPGQRKLIRLAAIGPRAPSERVYRVTVKPVAGELSSSETGLKLLIGYDVLVLLRPPEIRTSLSAVRSGSEITFRNNGNASIELIDGKQCTAGKTDLRCVTRQTPLRGGVMEPAAELERPGGIYGGFKRAELAQDLLVCPAAGSCLQSGKLEHPPSDTILLAPRFPVVVAQGAELPG